MKPPKERHIPLKYANTPFVFGVSDTPPKQLIISKIPLI